MNRPVPTGAARRHRGGVRANATARPALRRWLLWGAIALLFVVGALVVSAAIGLQVGGRAAGVALIAAVVPLLVVVPAFLWLDRFEAEPPRYLMFAFGWGALVATTVAIVLNTGSMIFLSETYIDADEIASVVVAPIVEESLKGLGVLLVLLVRRREFDGVIDGVVYAGLCAAGFAFAENVLYLGQAYNDQGTAGIAATFFVRCVLGPFAHPLFTLWTGIGIGIAASRRGVLARLAPFVGLAFAIVVHAAWNLSAVAGIEGFWSAYLLLQVPIFLTAIGVVVWARRREGRLIHEHLVTYARHGWLTPPEVTMLGTIGGRREARRWAQRAGGRRMKQAMVAFQDDAVDLAMLRQRMTHGTAGRDAADRELTLLHSITNARAGFRRQSPVLV